MNAADYLWAAIYHLTHCHTADHDTTTRVRDIAARYDRARVRIRELETELARLRTVKAGTP